VQCVLAVFQVTGKTLDQVTDMMVANAHNLIVTVKPANQRATLTRHSQARASAHSDDRSSSFNMDNGDSDDDQVADHHVLQGATATAAASTRRS